MSKQAAEDLMTALKIQNPHDTDEVIKLMNAAYSMIKILYNLLYEESEESAVDNSPGSSDPRQEEPISTDGDHEKCTQKSLRNAEYEKMINDLRTQNPEDTVEALELMNASADMIKKLYILAYRRYEEEADPRSNEYTEIMARWPFPVSNAV
jgi:hypothetical protein